MSSDYEIFARPRTPGSDVQVLGDLSRVTGAKFSLMDPSQEGWYLARPERGAIEVDFHTELLDDGDIPFGFHHIRIMVHKPRGGTLADAESFSHELYTTLVDTGRYDCFLVFNMGQLLALHRG